MRGFLMTGLIALILSCSATVVYADFPATWGMGNCSSPTVVVDSEGNARIAWSSDVTGVNEIYWAVFDNKGNRLLGPLQVSDTGAQSYVPRMDIDEQDRCFIIWTEGAGTSARMHFSRVDSDGSIGVTDIAPNIQNGTYKRNDIAVTPAGLSHIIIEHKYASLFYVYYAVLDENGGLVRKIHVSDRDIWGWEKYPSIDVDSDGTATMVWNDYYGFYSQGIYRAAYTAAGAQIQNSAILSQEDVNWTTICTPTPSSMWFFMQQGNHVMVYEGGNTHSRVSALPGPCRKPRVAGSAGSPLYAVWEDWSSGTPRVLASEWTVGGAVVAEGLAVSQSSGNATTPDIGDDGSGNYFVAWADSRNGAPDIYFDTVRSYSIRVTADVYEDHAEDDPITVGLPGVQVEFLYDNMSSVATTNDFGAARFAVDTDGPVSYRLSLWGEYYVVSNDGQPLVDQTAVKVTVPVPAGETATTYKWPSGQTGLFGPAGQAAYLVQRMRREYWDQTLGFEYSLPKRLAENIENEIRVGVMSDPATMAGTGGASMYGGYFLRVLTDKCFESSVIYHEMNHAMVANIGLKYQWGYVQINGEDREGGAIDEALADYFTASYRNDPVIDRCATGSWPLCWPRRHLANPRFYSMPSRYPSGDFGYSMHRGSTILSSTLWDLRNALDGVGAGSAPTTDVLLVEALEEMFQSGPADETSFKFNDLYTALLAVDTMNGSGHASDIEAVFSAHDMGSQPSGFIPADWDVEVPLWSVVDVGQDALQAVWSPIGGALEDVTYSVWTKTRSWLPGVKGVSDGYVLLASGLTDTTYVMADRDPHTEYTFMIEPVDAAGEVGYTSNEVFVPAADPTNVPSDPALPTIGRWLHAAPNPFNPVTRFSFETVRPGRVQVAVYDLTGRRVRLFAEQNLMPGKHAVVWDGRDDGGRQVASGSYLVKIKGSDWSDHGKVVLLK